MDLDERMTAVNARILRDGRTLVRKRVEDLRKGRHTIRIAVPRRVESGSARLRIAFRDTSTNLKQVRRGVRIPRKLRRPR